ncbi:MAG: DNA repair protein RecO [Anaerovoracaceae bacterium]|jgi:DNA repair protein RecO (recombination protein O)
MNVETEAIILRQTRLLGGRRLLHLFTREQGRMTAGAYARGRGRQRSTLALQPFTRGQYVIRRRGRSSTIVSAEEIHSYYGLGEDVDKYFAASRCLELAAAMVQEEQPAPGLYDLTVSLLTELERRRGRCGTLVLAFETKALQEIGLLPELNRCVSCGSTGQAAAFSVPGGGVLCADCRRREEAEAAAKGQNDRLIYDIDFGIMSVLKYFLTNPLQSLKKLALKEEIEDRTETILREYIRYHLDLRSLRSEEAAEPHTARSKEGG